VVSDAVGLAEARRKALLDREWLILPIEPLEGGAGYSGLLDDACIVRKEKFRLT